MNNETGKGIESQDHQELGMYLSNFGKMLMRNCRNRMMGRRD